MPEVRISELPVASSVGASDVLAIVQGGVSKQAAFSLFQAGFLAASNNLNDLDDEAVARTNLDVLSSAEVASAISSAVANFVTDTVLNQELAGIHVFVPKINNGGGSTSVSLQSYWTMIIVLDFDYTPDYFGGPDEQQGIILFPTASSQAGRQVRLDISVKNQTYHQVVVRQSDGAFAFRAQNNSNNWKGVHSLAAVRGPSDAPSVPGNEEDEYLSTEPGTMYFESDGSLWQVYYGGVDF
jgi:hypothetical protein